MKGELRYARGDDFDARQEFMSLTRRVAAEARHRGYWSAVRLLIDVAGDGFDPIEMHGLIAPTEVDDLMLFEDAGVRLAFDVPNNGLFPTSEATLLAAEFCPGRGDAIYAVGRSKFIAVAVDRRSKGQRATWPLANA